MTSVSQVCVKCFKWVSSESIVGQLCDKSVSCVLKGWIGGRPVSCEVCEECQVCFKCVSSLCQVCDKCVKCMSSVSSVSSVFQV